MAALGVAWNNINMEIKKFIELSDLFAAAAQDFSIKVRQSLAKKDYFDVALLGGSSALGLFKAINQLTIPNKHKIRFFFSDERAVAITDDKSNAKTALSNLNFDKNQFFCMYDENLGLELSVKAYEDLLKNNLLKDKSGVPVFDLIYLGIGTDGHTASLFPNSDLLDNKTDLVASFAHKDILCERITLCPKIICAAKSIAFIAYGEDKKNILNNTINNYSESFNYPAKRIIDKALNSVVLFTA